MIPTHLATVPWYAPHQAWCLSTHGTARHVPPEGTVPRRADLSDANLFGTDLRDANLSDAILPDGRTLAQWREDPLAGLCDDPESVARAISAWGGRTWRDCPLHAGLGVSGFDDVAAEKRDLAATFVALLDGGHLPQPSQRIVARETPC